MERRLIGFKSVAVSTAVGTAFVLLLFSLTEASSLRGIARTLLLPGAAMADAFGGAHDLAAFVIYIIGNIVLYAIIAMVAFMLSAALGKKQQGARPR